MCYRKALLDVHKMTEIARFLRNFRGLTNKVDLPQRVRELLG
jgi:hypothetical protein